MTVSQVTGVNNIIIAKTSNYNYDVIAFIYDIDGYACTCNSFFAIDRFSNRVKVVCGS